MKKLTNEQKNIIKQKIPLDNSRYIVRLNVAGNKNIPLTQYKANIYCIDDQDEIIWQVNLTKDDSPFENDCFVYIGLNEGGQIEANSFRGCEYFIDAKTGAAHLIGWHK